MMDLKSDGRDVNVRLRDDVWGNGGAWNFVFDSDSGSRAAVTFERLGDCHTVRGH